MNDEIGRKAAQVVTTALTMMRTIYHIILYV